MRRLMPSKSTTSFFLSSIFVVPRSSFALFGPTDPRLWGPWPSGGLNEPWAASGTIQRRGNVWLVQNPDILERRD